MGRYFTQTISFTGFKSILHTPIALHTRPLKGVLPGTAFAPALTKDRPTKDRGTKYRGFFLDQLNKSDRLVDQSGDAIPFTRRMRQ